MKHILLLSFAILLCAQTIHSQSKKELRAEVEDLKQEIAQKDQALAEVRQSENISKANAEEYKAQVDELKDANTTLLSNIKTLTEATAQRSDNITRTLETIRSKEAQLKVVNEEITAFDSIALLVLSDFKKTLGENAKVGVQKDGLIVQLNEMGLFGSGSNASVQPEGANILDKVTNTAKQHQSLSITLVVGLAEGSNNDLIKKRAEAIVSKLQDALSPDIQKISLKYKNGLSSSYQVRLHPDWNTFYLKVRETVKSTG